MNWSKTDISSFSVPILHSDNGGFRLRLCSVRFISVNCSETTYVIDVSFRRFTPRESMREWSTIVLQDVVIFNPR